MSEYEKPYYILLEGINEAIKIIDTDDTETVKLYLLVIKNIAEEKLKKEKM